MKALRLKTTPTSEPGKIITDMFLHATKTFMNNFGWKTTKICLIYDTSNKKYYLYTVFDSNIVGSFNIIKLCSELNIPLVYSASSTKFATEGVNTILQYRIHISHQDHRYV